MTLRPAGDPIQTDESVAQSAVCPIEPVVVLEIVSSTRSNPQFGAGKASRL